MSTTQPLANLADMVRERAGSRGNATAYEFEGRVTSFAEGHLLDAEGRVLAKASSTLRLVPRDQVTASSRRALGE